MSCKDVCKKFRALKPIGTIGRYASGQKRCQICDLFVNWEGIHCPCCGKKLRATPRNSIYKKKNKIFAGRI